MNAISQNSETGQGFHNYQVTRIVNREGVNSGSSNPIYAVRNILCLDWGYFADNEQVMVFRS